ncbi:MAG: hypothetical protein HZA22_08150 [Nitrospirae bacterium]|nr:hypothetical protein [Nitrospirota bacterium]
MKTIPYILLILLLAVSAVLHGCGGEQTDEDLIKAAIQEMAEGAEAKDLGRVKGHISDGYKDPAGNDYQALKGIMAFYFMQPESINVFLRRQEVEIRDGKGYATVRAVISRGAKAESVTDLVPSEAGGFIFDFTFEKEGGDWMLTSAIWRQVGMAEAL